MSRGYRPCCKRLCDRPSKASPHRGRSQAAPVSEVPGSTALSASGAISVRRYHDSHCNDKEVLITIQKAVDAISELRSKKALIETFIQGINDVSDVLLEWRTFVAEEKEKQLAAIIAEENLKDQETRRFMEHAFRDGSVRTTGTDIDKLMPPISRFGGGNRAEKKQTIIVKLQAFFERFFGIG